VTTGIVVGASGGIGSAAARVLAPTVDSLVITGRRRSALDELAAEIGESAIVAVADIATPEGREAVVAPVDGELAWVVVASGVPLRTPFTDADPSEIEQTFAVNLLAPALLLRRLMDCAWTTPGRIVIVGSVSASRTLPDRAVYSATKAGLEHLGKSLAAELAPREILVNVVAPGVVETPFLGEHREALESWIGVNVPARRAGTSDEVAEVIRFLAVEAPTYVTGARIAVDGGVEARA
jgi:3-oxoacyl-[acyl-carrier protein] reductase